MKKPVCLTLALMLAVMALAACKAKVKEVPPPPQAQEQPRVQPAAPPPPPPPPSEEEIFKSKSLEQINREQPLKMIYFDYDKYFIREDAKPVLSANASWLNKFRSVRVLIEGHCDERGTEDYNLALGEKRAKSAYDYLLSLGIPAERLQIISYGKSQPFDPGHNEISWQRNRRAQFTIIAK
ncbi:MAG: peptidoglycan-associated lipoprotein Pal [Candidatus Aminicenantes bacterium]|nr:peptidoglycan-associated lipoprotein Pal [Candidatus Aminicenantes bacterium]